MKSFAHVCHWHWCHCTDTGSLPYQNNIYKTVPCVSIPLENRSCPESTRCCDRCVIPISWFQFTTRVGSTLVTSVGVGRRLCELGAHDSKLASISSSNSLITVICLAASPQRHVFMSPPCKKIIQMYIYMLSRLLIKRIYIYMYIYITLCLIRTWT